MINYFLHEKTVIQELMLAELAPERYMRLSAQAAMANRFLEFALEKPQDVEE